MRNSTARSQLLCLTILILGLAARVAQAEPYIAVQQGLACNACHVNPTGGGLRSLAGDAYAQAQMPLQTIDTGHEPWLGNLGSAVRAGGDFRDDFTYTEVPHQPSTNAAGIDDLRLYTAFDLIRDRLMLYVDELLAPGAAQTREAYGLLWLTQHQLYLKVGQFYQPFGLRLQDDESYVRQASGFNYTTPDNGAELGWLKGPWNAQLAVTNGSAGAAETNRGKQAIANLVFVQPVWRVGASYSENPANGGRRQVGAVFAGLRTGPIAWLAEGDRIADSSQSPTLDELAGLIEADWLFLRGNNLKLTAEYLDPSTHIAHNQRNRFSAVWEFTPIMFLQTRLGFRDYNGIPQNDLQNRREAFAELHVFF